MCWPRQFCPSHRASRYRRKQIGDAIGVSSYRPKITGDGDEAREAQVRPLVELDARRQQRGRELEHTPAPEHSGVSPADGGGHGERVTRLFKGLGSAEGVEESKKALRALLERIVLAPAAEGPEKDLPLERDLAGMVPLAAGAQGPNADKVSKATP